MSDELHTSGKSRQALLDEIYYLRDLAGEREQQIRRLQVGTKAGEKAMAEVDLILHSRLWRFTAPVRRIARALVRLSTAQPRRLSKKSRQALLDEIHSLREVVDERERCIRRLEAGNTEVDEIVVPDHARILRSRSWRLAMPLRWLARVLGPARRNEAKTPTNGSLHGSQFHEERTDDARSMPASSATVEPRASGGKHLYVDVTELALREGKTGVQRVTREVLRCLLTSPPEGYVVLPVYAAPGQPYRLAERSVAHLLGIGYGVRTDALMTPCEDDVFLGLDHSMQAVVEHASDLNVMHRHGVRIWFECNDTLPLEHPEWFPAEVPPKFETWLRTVLSMADGVACISKATETGLRRWLDEWQIQRKRPLILGHFPLGADLVPHAPDVATDSGNASVVLKRLHRRRAFLMVGTLEPRKGHAQALEAFNQLWARGHNIALVIVGLPGWMTEVVQRRIRHHDELGKRLFWFADASDALLEQLYQHCTALLAPSQGEGFGLPLVEAARHRLPILCRDLPVFHEVAGEFASYFSGDDATSLAQAIESWLEARRQGRVPSTDTMPRLSWAESAQQLLGVILDGRADTILTNNRQGSKRA